MIVCLRPADYTKQHWATDPIQRAHVYSEVLVRQPGGLSQRDIAIQTLSLQLAYDSFQQHHLPGLDEFSSLYLV
jgi:hypothetical protein